MKNYRIPAQMQPYEKSLTICHTHNPNLLQTRWKERKFEEVLTEIIENEENKSEKKLSNDHQKTET